MSNLKGQRDIILYNPVKGAKITKGLISANRDFTFIHLKSWIILRFKTYLKGLNYILILVIILAKIECLAKQSMADCCVITGKRGSANNSIDVPIPQKYKLDDSKLVDNSVFREIVLDIFSDYEKIY